MRRAIRALALAVAVAACTAPGAAAASPVLPGGPAPAPAFRVRAASGETLELAALLRRGPVLLDFWATWCRPCLQSIPELVDLHRRWSGRGLTVIGISIDGPRNQARVMPFARRLGVRYPVVLDEDGSLQERYHVRVVPTAVLVDTSGAIALVQQGWRPGETRALEERIAALLGAAADSGAERIAR